MARKSKKKVLARKVVKTGVIAERKPFERVAIPGFVRGSELIERSGALVRAGIIASGLKHHQTLRDWRAGKFRGEFPVDSDELRPVGNTVVYPEGKANLIIAWYAARQTGEDTDSVLARIESYYASNDAA